MIDQKHTNNFSEKCSGFGKTVTEGKSPADVRACHPHTVYNECTKRVHEYGTGNWGTDSKLAGTVQDTSRWKREFQEYTATSWSCRENISQAHTGLLAEHWTNTILFTWAAAGDPGVYEEIRGGFTKKCQHKEDKRSRKTIWQGGQVDISVSSDNLL